MIAMSWRQVGGAPKHVQDAFKAKARILVDESLGHGVASFLSDQGCNVVFAGDIGLAGKDDEAVAAYAWREKRMIWTHDRDFLDDARVPEHRNPGVVVLPGGDGNLDAMVHGLHVALTVFARGGRLWSKTKASIAANGEMTIRSRDEVGKVSSNRYRLMKTGVEEWYDD
jgi:predicted nuclease of predicted toxin-antitoxin system